MIILHNLGRREGTLTDLFFTDGEIRPIHEANHFLWHMQRGGGGGLAPRSLLKYAQDVADCHRYFEAIGVPLREGTSVHLQEYFRHMEESRENMATTINGRVQSITSFFRFLASHDYILRLPFTERIYHANSRGMLGGTTRVTVRSSDLRRREPSREGVKVLSRDQLREFIARIGSVRDKLIAKLMWATGLRIEEAVNFTLNEFHLPRDLAGYVRNEKPFLATIIGKGQKPRQVEIPSAILRDILSYRESFRPASKCENLFVDSHGEPIKPGAIQAAFRRLSRKIGIKVKPHDFRHGFAIERIIFWERIFDEEERRKGTRHERDEKELLEVVRYKTLKTVQIELGHNHITTTEKYLKYLNRYKQAAQNGHQKFMQQLGEEPK